MRIYLILLVALMLVAATAVVAQESKNPGTTLSGQISGQVRYADNNQPAFNVVVSCDSFQGGHVGDQFTDRNGRFQFSGLTPSQYNVRVRVGGYLEEQQTVELLTTPSAYVQFRLRSDGSKPAGVSSLGVTNTNVPPTAKSEFDQAVTLLADGKKENLEGAIVHLQKAIAIYPQYLEAELRLGTVYMDLREWDKAELALKKTIEIDPKAANAYFALGEVYHLQKKYDDAEKILQNGLAIESRSAPGHLTLARVYWDRVAGVKEESKWRPSLEKAYQEVKQALELDPKLADAHFLRGNLLFKVNRYPDAQQEYEQYLQLEPNGRYAATARSLADRIKKGLAESQKP